MPLTYTNRKGDVYYLHAGKTPKGTPKYYFSRDAGGNCIDAMPPGYEAYETPEAGLVYARKIKPAVLSPFEREMVCDGIRRHTRLEHFRVDIQDSSLVVYLPSTDGSELKRLMEGRLLQSPRRAQAVVDSMVASSAFVKMMRFVLVDEDQRLFHTERWCFLGSIDRWTFLDGPAPLVRLVDKYVRHLGQQSFFDLM